MTKAAFEKWITQHYGELLAVARRLVNRDPEDIVQKAIVSALANKTYLRARAPWTFYVNAIRGEASHARRAARRAQGVPGSISSEERNTATAGRHKLRRLPPMKDAERYADRLYLKKLEQDRRIFDMDGYGRTKADKAFEVRLPGEQS